MHIERRKALLVPILAFVLALVWLRPLDDIAERYTETGFQRALATFAAARTLNAGISVLRSASVDVQIVVGGTIRPGAVLDPLDEIVEQFSALMLAATVSFAAQHLLIEVAGAPPVCWLLTFLVVSWGMARWQNWSLPAWLPNLTLGLLCLRLAVPVVALGSEATYRILLASGYEASQAQIKITESPDVEVKDGTKHWWAPSTDIAKKIEALKAKADGLVEHFVRLAAVFIIQIIVLPLLFLWAMLLLYRFLSSPSYTPITQKTI